MGAEVLGDVGFEFVDVGEGELDGVEGGVVEEGGEVHGVPDVGGGVDGVGVEEGGVGEGAAPDGEVVAFPAREWGSEVGAEGFGEIVYGADVEEDFVGVGHPVESAPDFAAEDLSGSDSRVELAEGFDGRGSDGEVGGVLVGGVVGVDDFGLSDLEDGEEFVGEGRVGRVFDDAAGVAELVLGGVLAGGGRGVLFLVADFLHLLVGEVGEGADTGAAGAVGAGDAAEPEVGVVIAGDDAVVGHELEVVVVGADAEVGDAGEGGWLVGAVGDEKGHDWSQV